MYPTLIPSDVILADTQSYKSQPTQQRDIVVFNVPGTRLVFVKRIVKTRSDSFDATGDNKNET